MGAMDWTPQPPPQRARLTREEKRQQTRGRLLEAAHALFSAKGLEATSVDEIAATAGYTRGAFYANYSSKLDLMKELIEQGFDSDIEALALFESASTLEELAEAYAAYGRRFEEDPASLMWTMEFQMAAMRYPELRDAYTAQFATLMERVRSFVDRMIAAEDAAGREILVRALAETLSCLQPALAVHRLLAPQRVPPESLEIAFTALMRGAGVEAPSR